MNTKAEPGSEFDVGPAGEFLRSLWQLNHELERASRQMEATSGVTTQQRMMIRCVGKYPGMTASQLAEQFHLDAGTVSTALGRLERKGLIERRRGHRDRRRVTLGLTASGRMIDRGEAGAMEHAVETLLETTSAENVKCVRNVLQDLTQLLERKLQHAGHGAKEPALSVSF